MSLQKTLRSHPPPLILPKNKHGDVASSVECQEERGEERRGDGLTLSGAASPLAGRREERSIVGDVDEGAFLQGGL